MNVLLLLGTLIGLAGLSLAAILSVIMGARLRAALLGLATVSWAVLYAGGLLATSLLSHTTLLPAGATKRFCGFYLDCHLGVAVRHDSTPSAIAGRRASGSWHILTLEFSSNARRATLTPSELRLELVDVNGTHYERDLAAEAALAGGRPHPIARAIAAGGSYSVPVVFDLPIGVMAPRLLAREGMGLDFALETVLLGDEDSFLHRKVLLALPAASSVRQELSVR